MEVATELGIHVSSMEIKDMIAFADTNNDGELTFDDFYQVRQLSQRDSRPRGEPLPQPSPFWLNSKNRNDTTRDASKQNFSANVHRFRYRLLHPFF